MKNKPLMCICGQNPCVGEMKTVEDLLRRLSQTDKKMGLYFHQFDGVLYICNEENELTAIGHIESGC